MSIDNVLASVAVANLEESVAWYGRLLGRPADKRPMAEVAEWAFPRGGVLQVYALAERAGRGSCTLAVSDLEAAIRTLEAMGVDTRERGDSDIVRTVMVQDPSGNHIALAQALTDAVSR